jgi:hypothetical protein
MGAVVVWVLDVILSIDFIGLDMNHLASCLYSTGWSFFLLPFLLPFECSVKGIFLPFDKLVKDMKRQDGEGRRVMTDMTDKVAGWLAG